MNKTFCISCLLLLSSSITVNATSWESLGNAGWSARNSHQAVALPTGEIFVMGGFGGSFTRFNDVWISNDKGNSWSSRNNAGWSARNGHVAVALPTDEIVVMGGRDGNYNDLNDVWISDDKGISWTEQTSNAGWDPRREHVTVALPTGEIVVMGGFDGDYPTDVWISDDKGISWTEQTSNTGWSGRMEHTAVVLSTGEIVVMGGFDGTNRLNDVWVSDDKGISWTEQTGNAPWTARSGHVAVALPTDEIVVMGGFDGTNRLNDVWVSDDKGISWTEQTGNAPWTARSHHVTVILPTGEIVIMGGLDVTRLNDVWSYDTLEPSPSPSASPSMSPSVTPSTSSSETPSVTPSLTASPTSNETPSTTPSLSSTPSVSPSTSSSETPSVSPSTSSSETPSVSPSTSSSETPSVTPSLSTSPTSSVTPSNTPTPSTTPSAPALPSPHGIKNGDKTEIKSDQTLTNALDRIQAGRNGYDARTAAIKRKGGQMTVVTEFNTMVVDLVSIEEVDVDGNVLATFTDIDSLDFDTFTQKDDYVMGTALAFKLSQTAVIASTGTRITFELYSFHTSGIMTFGDDTFSVEPHDVKLIVRVEFWPFTPTGTHLLVTLNGNNDFFAKSKLVENGKDVGFVWGPHMVRLSSQTKTNNAFTPMLEGYPKVGDISNDIVFALNRGHHMEFDPLFAETNVTQRFQLFEKAGENHLGDPICPSGFELRRVSGDESDWMTGFDSTDDLPFCTRVYDTEQEICPDGMRFHRLVSIEESDGSFYHGCAGLSTTCCAYPKPSNCGIGGYCPKSLGSDGDLCQVPWTGLCNNHGSCRDNQCVCEHGFGGASCADAPACDSVTDYEEWIPISNCYPLCGTNRKQVEKKRPKDDKYWCPTLSREATCVDGNDLSCDQVPFLTSDFWETVDFNSLVGFVGESNEIGNIVSLLISQDEYGGRLVFTGNDTLAEDLVDYRNQLGMLPLVTGSSVRDHLNDLYLHTGDDETLEITLTRFLLEINATVHTHRFDSLLRDSIGVGDEIVNPADVPENLVKSIKELTDRLGESPIEEFGDIDTLRTLILLSQTKVGTNKTDKCEYYEAPLRPKGCTGHCGTGSRTIRWVPKPGQPSYCTVIHEEEECQLLRLCPEFETVVALGDASCQYTDWTKWSECQTSGQKGDVQGWQGRSRDRIMGHEDQCVDTFEYRPCNVMTGKRLATTRNLFLQHTIQTYQSSGENVVIMSVVLLSLSVILGFVLIPRIYWPNQMYLS